MGKTKKEHRRRVARRNEQIKHQTRTVENAKRKFIMDLIEKEKQAGLFENNPTLVTDMPIIVEGPQI